ncbi:hypothetical protein C8Q73DRAFT_702365 [Cubamyces lactineus]|nr:hypothetical protein C8Q73DRAFT_702365 [Cubamyces lactineus]
MADEYDDLPDAFEGVDFDAIPELSTIVEDKSDYDDFFDDIDPSVLDGVPHLGPLHSRPATPEPVALTPLAAEPDAQIDLDIDVNIPPPGHTLGPGEGDQTAGPGTAQMSQSASASSTQYGFDDVDDAFLQQVGELEQDAIGRALPGNRGASVVPVAPSRAPSQLSGNRPSQKRALKRKISDVTTTPSTSSGKRSKLARINSKNVDPHASARKVLEKIEEELTCPICYDLLVAAHSTNPCGHSCCGECHLNFLKTVPVRKPTCPVCRTPLDINRPLLPNFTVDGIVRSHVLALAETGSVDWQPNGTRHQEHARRKEEAPKVAEEIAQLRFRPRLPAAWTDSQVMAIVDGMEEEDSDFVDEGEGEGEE